MQKGSELYFVHMGGFWACSFWYQPRLDCHTNQALQDLCFWLDPPAKLAFFHKRARQDILFFATLEKLQPGYTMPQCCREPQDQRNRVVHLTVQALLGVFKAGLAS